MTSPLLNTLVFSSLNKFDLILKNPETIAFHSYICKHKNKSGNVFIKNILIKCCELLMKPELINATSKDILISDTDITVNIKLFIGKMVNTIYDNKLDLEVPINGIYNMYFEEIIGTITKDSLLLEIFKYINTLEKDAIAKLDNGKQLFGILIDVLYNMLITKFDECSNKITLGDSKTVITLLNTLNMIYEFKSDNYEYDSSDTSDSSDSSDYEDSDSDSSSNSESLSDDDNNDDGDDDPKQLNKRRIDEENTEQNKKRKTD